MCFCMFLPLAFSKLLHLSTNRTAPRRLFVLHGSDVAPVVSAAARLLDRGPDHHADAQAQQGVRGHLCGAGTRSTRGSFRSVEVKMSLKDWPPKCP